MKPISRSGSVVSILSAVKPCSRSGRCVSILSAQLFWNINARSNEEKEYRTEPTQGWYIYLKNLNLSAKRIIIKI